MCLNDKSIESNEHKRKENCKPMMVREIMFFFSWIFFVLFEVVEKKDQLILTLLILRDTNWNKMKFFIHINVFKFNYSAHYISLANGDINSSKGVFSFFGEFKGRIFKYVKYVICIFRF